LKGREMKTQLLRIPNRTISRNHLAGIDVIAGNTVLSTPERLECEILQKDPI